MAFTITISGPTWETVNHTNNVTLVFKDNPSWVDVILDIHRRDSIRHVIIEEPAYGILSGAFSRCYNLQSLSLPSTLLEIGEAFRDCRKLRRVTIPESVNCIWPGAFSPKTEVLAPTGHEALSLTKQIFLGKPIHEDDIKLAIKAFLVLKQLSLPVEIILRILDMVPGRYSIYHS